MNQPVQFLPATPQQPHQEIVRGDGQNEKDGEGEPAGPEGGLHEILGDDGPFLPSQIGDQMRGGIAERRYADITALGHEPTEENVMRKGQAQRRRKQRSQQGPRRPAARVMDIAAVIDLAEKEGRLVHIVIGEHRQRSGQKYPKNDARKAEWHKGR